MKFAKFMQHAKAPTSAADCKTKKELDAWRAVREAPIKAFVPKRWQHFESIQQQYEESLKRITQSQANSGQAGTESIAAVAPVELQVEHGFPLDDKQFTLARIDTPEVQDLVPTYAKHMEVQRFLSFATFIQESG